MSAKPQNRHIIALLFPHRARFPERSAHAHVGC